MMNRIVTSIQQIVASLAETPSLFYYWYIYFLYSPIFLHNKLMLSTYNLKQLIFLQNKMFDNIYTNKVGQRKKLFVRLFISPNCVYTYLIKCIVFLHT